MKLFLAPSPAHLLRTAAFCGFLASTVVTSSLHAQAGDVTAPYASADDVPVTAGSFTATGRSISFSLGCAPPAGTTLKVVENTGLDFIQGTFSNLAQGQEVKLSFSGTSYRFVANYYGGTGNDLVLQWADVVPVGWGGNGPSPLGNNSSQLAYFPTGTDASGVLSGRTIIALAAGYYHNMALCSDGTLAAWGYNSQGELGDGTTDDRWVPVDIQDSGDLYGRRVVAVAAGSGHCLALCSDGFLVGWGVNDFGQLGPSLPPYVTTPTTLTHIGLPAGRKVVAISAGGSFSLALCADGTVMAWGHGGGGELGDGLMANSNTPVAVSTAGVLAGKKVTAISAGGSHALALCSDGALVGWGYNTNGQLGTGTVGVSAVPVAVEGSGVLAGKAVASIKAGDYFSMAVCSDGSVAGWGANGGELGDNSQIERHVPVLVDASGVLAGKKVVMVATGQAHCVALCSDGTAAAWGSVNDGQLGIGHASDDSLVPVAVSTLPFEAGARVVSVASGNSTNYNLALLALPASQRRPVASGTFAGLIEPDSGRNRSIDTHGYFTATIQASRSFTSKLVIEGMALSLAGKLDDEGNALFGGKSVLVINRFPKLPLAISFKYGPLDEIFGSVSHELRGVPVTTSIIHASRTLFNGRSMTSPMPPDWLGKAGASGIFNVIMPWLPPADLSSDSPQPPGLGLADYPYGTGYAECTVSRTGVFSFSGNLADGTAFTASAPVTGDARIQLTVPLFRLLYNNRGFISAGLLLDSTSDESDFEEFLHWCRPATNSQYYPYGWPETISTRMIGAKYAVKAGASVIPFLEGASPAGNAFLELDDGLGFNATSDINISTADKVTKAEGTTGFLTVSINRSTGLFSGIADFDAHTRPAFHGIIYQKGSWVGGWGFGLSVLPKVKDYSGHSFMVQLRQADH